MRRTQVHDLYMKTNESGFMVVELVVALFVIGIGLMALAETMVGSFQGIQEGQQKSTAVFLADQRLEELKAVEWTTLNDCLGSLVCSGPDASPYPYQYYGRVSTVADVQPGLRLVTVYVAYQPVGGASGQVEISTLVARR
jgi:type II secretory pathway pseudopilin PulG